jgi:hypothetical protein
MILLVHVLVRLVQCPCMHSFFHREDVLLTSSLSHTHEWPLRCHWYAASRLVWRTNRTPKLLCST